MRGLHQFEMCSSLICLAYSLLRLPQWFAFLALQQCSQGLQIDLQQIPVLYEQPYLLQTVTRIALCLGTKAQGAA